MRIKYKKYSNGYNYLNRSKREYYERMIFPKSVSLFSEIWQSEKNAIHIDVPVVFRGLHFGDSPKIILRKLGKPRFVIENYGISSLIFFYKEKINNHKVIMQVHCLDEEFFCACYVFRYENEADRMGIKKMLFEKYATTPADDEIHSHLIDRGKNIISIFDMVNFNILYLSGSDKVKEVVSSSLHSNHLREEIKKQTTQQELMQKL